MGNYIEGNITAQQINGSEVGNWLNNIFYRFDGKIRD
jgi:hypothetical protein